jgi:hypothetical protein
MRKSLMFVGIPVAVAVVGVAVAVGVARHGSGAKPTDKFAADLQSAQAAGLDLAQSQGATKYALTEIAPDSKPAPAKTVKQGNGTKAIRSKTPTVKAAPEPVAAQVVENVPETQVTQTAADPTPAAVVAPAVPRPVPQTTPSSGADQGPILAGGTGRGTGTTSDGGSGGGWGGIFGAIIRGGVVGGDDNCDPRGGARRPQGPYGGSGVYRPSPGGMGGARMPVIQLPTGIFGGSRPRR